MSKITYPNKVSNNGQTIQGKFFSADANEIKTSVNLLYDEVALKAKNFIKSNESLAGASRKGDVLYGILDQYTGEELTLYKVTGTPTVDNVIYFQLESEYFKRNFDVLDVKMFGALGDGVTSDVTAFNAAIAFANAKGGTDRANIKGTTIKIPEGRYLLDASLSPITVSSVSFVGVDKSSSVLLITATTPVFTFGDASMVRTVVGGGASNLKLEYLGNLSGNPVVFNVDFAFSLDFSNIFLENIGTLLNLGATSSRISAGVTLTNITGSIANVGLSLINLNYGAGLILNNVKVFVRGVLAPSGNEQMTTVLGTHVFKCNIGFWDALQASNCLFERFDIGIAIDATSGMVYQNFFFTNVIMDYLKRYPIYLNNNGGVITGVRIDNACWLASWEQSCVFIDNISGYLDNIYIAATMPISGTYSVYYKNTTAKNIIFNSVEIGACNRLGTIDGALRFITGSKGFSVVNCKGNFDLTAEGLPYRADFGVYIGTDCDNYIVNGCDIEGEVTGYFEAGNATGSKNRIIKNNLKADYMATTTETAPTSAEVYINKTGFTESWTFIGGTLTGNYTHNGVSMGQPSFITIRLFPNDTLSATYSAAPTVVKTIEN